MTRQFLARILTSVVVAVSGVSLGVASFDAEAKRLGSGRAAGMQRQMPAKPADSATPAKPATPNAAPGQNAANPAQAAPGMAAAAAQPAKRSWMGPIAGLAAGLGLAALASHFGFGEQLANFMMMAMLAVVVMVAIGWIMRRMRGGNAAAQGPQLAGAGAPFPSSSAPFQAQQPMAREAFGGQSPSVASGLAAGAGAAAVGASGAAQPEAFDAEAFTRIAKMIFIRMQAVNDAGNVDDLRKFTTPELFASLRLDLQERGAAPQQTDVVQLDAELLDVAEEGGQWVASVRFKGLIREEASQGALPFAELWHLVRPLKGSTDWAIAGITPEAV
jgi:predicted lipid-binding transport protein (Tim44 family)